VRAESLVEVAAVIEAIQELSPLFLGRKTLQPPRLSAPDDKCVHELDFYLVHGLSLAYISLSRVSRASNYPLDGRSGKSADFRV
jgi:hypothetical protein